MNILRVTMAAAAVAVALLGGQACAAGVDFDIYGTVSAKNGPGNDANIAVGDLLHLTAHVGDERIVEWGSFGYKIAFVYGLNASGAENFHLDLGGLSWTAFDDKTDGSPTWFDQYGPDEAHYGGAAIVFQGAQVLGVVGYLSPVGSGAPGLDLGSLPGFGLNDPGEGIQEFDEPILSGEFHVFAADGAYGNFYETPGFTGNWRFEDGASVPESSTWTIMALGLGAAGTWLRRRRGNPHQRADRKRWRPSFRPYGQGASV